MIPLLLAVLLAGAPKVHHIRVAVVDFDDVTGTVAPQARLLTQVAVSEVSANGHLDVISSAEVRNLLGLERQRKLLGCTEDSSCLAEIGGALGVDFVVTGQLGRLGKRFRLDLRLIDAAKAHMVASVGAFITGPEEDLGEATVSMVRKLLREGHLSVAGTADEPAGGLTRTAGGGPSRVPAWVAAGGALALAAGALAMTLQTQSTYRAAKACYGDPAQALSSCGKGDASLKWSGPVADGLWAGAAVCAGLSAFLFLRPSGGGSGGELGVGGRF